MDSDAPGGAVDVGCSDAGQNRKHLLDMVVGTPVFEEWIFQA
jgi:hypothetical protein